MGTPEALVKIGLELRETALGTPEAPVGVGLEPRDAPTIDGPLYAPPGLECHMPRSKPPTCGLAAKSAREKNLGRGGRAMPSEMEPVGMRLHNAS